MNSKSFKKLQSLWYRRLAKEGFKDIEYSDNSIKRGYPRGESWEEYYRLASQYLYDKSFPSRLYKEVWRMHSMGYTVRAVAKEVGVSSSQTQRIIKYLRKEFFGT